MTTGGRIASALISCCVLSLMLPHWLPLLLPLHERRRIPGHLGLEADKERVCCSEPGFCLLFGAGRSLPPPFYLYTDINIICGRWIFNTTKILVFAGVRGTLQTCKVTKINLESRHCILMYPRGCHLDTPGPKLMLAYILYARLHNSDLILAITLGSSR